MPKRLLLSALVFSSSWLSLAMAAPTGAQCERLIATGNPEYPPYLWQDPANPQKLIGASADLLAQLGKEIGVEIEVIYAGPWSRAKDEVRTGRIDLVAGVFLTQARLETIDYVHPPYAMEPTMVWVHNGREISVDDAHDLKGLTGGTVVGKSFGDSFDAFRRGHLQLEEVASLGQAFQKLTLDRTDYVLYEQSPGQAMALAQGVADQVHQLERPVALEGLHIGLSHNSACNEPWLRGQLAQKMTKLVAAGLPDQLVQTNQALWLSQQAQPASDSKANE